MRKVYFSFLLILLFEHLLPVMCCASYNFLAHSYMYIYNHIYYYDVYYS